MSRAPVRRPALFIFMTDNSMYLIDEYVNVTAGEPYRLFPFGKIIKGGKTREITRELAAKFKLPHFKPPIKLGSHKDETPAGGFITGLEVRSDGLYARIETTEKGAKAFSEGDYRYHSPEIIWSGSLEDPKTGEEIKAPLIVGDAILHTPHLGEATAFYSIEKEQSKMEKETVEVPKGLWQRIEERFFAEPQEEPKKDEQPAVDVEKFAALEAERDELTAKLKAIEAEKAKTALVEQFAAQLKETKVKEGAEMLAGMTDEQSKWVVEQFKALSAQIDESKLTGELGSDKNGLPDNPAAAFDTAVKAYQKEHDGVDYNTALQAVVATQPELYAAYRKGA